MHAPDDIKSLYSFLNQTPEGALRKMLLAGEKTLTEIHFRVLVKLAKGGSEADFVDSFNAENFGKLPLSTKETFIKEKFWTLWKVKFQALGLMGAAKAA